MSRAAAIYTIITILGVAVLGFFGINFMNSHHASCIVSVSQGGACPETENAIDFINFHFNALKNFSSAALSSFGVLAALLVLVLLIVFGERRTWGLPSAREQTWQ